MTAKFRSEVLTAQGAGKKLHQLTDEELSDHWVSEHSQFKDVTWYFTNPTPGVKTSSSTINWEMALIDGSRLTEKKHASRLHWSKMLILTLLELPAKGRRPSPSTIGTTQSELNCLLSWMSLNGYHHPSELTPDVINHYIDDLPTLIAKEGKEEGVTTAMFNRALAIPIRLWDQRNALQKLRVKSLLSHPFNGQGANTIAEALATKARGWIKPLPDEVAIPLFNKAASFLGKPAEDVIRLLDVVRDPLAGAAVRRQHWRGGTYSKVGGRGKQARLSRARRFLEAFEFSTLRGDEKPWHEQLDAAYDMPSGRQRSRLTRIRELWEAVREAAAILVQGSSGMRVSELLGIKAGIDKATGLPVGVRLEKSITGLYEWFVIRTVLSKAEEGLGREVDWILGMRPIGSVEVPIAVHALHILNAIHEPWRATARTDLLILASRVGQTLPRPSLALGGMKGDAMCAAMQRFIARWIDLSCLPDESARKSEDNDLAPWRESRGAIFTTHMLRKSWANFTLACDARLLPAIQMQFHHLSLAMTEGGYIGRNPLLLEALDSVAVQKRNSLIYELVTGRARLAGRMGEQLDEAVNQLRAEIGDLPTSEKWKRTAEWSDRNHLQMYFSPHATCCPTRTSEMRCHDASKTPIWIRSQPNTATREPSLCAGCACAVMDKSHEPFWSDRYVSSLVSIKQAEAAGINVDVFRAIQFRADQARSILKKFGADIDTLDARVALEMEAEHA